jgi:cohesin complex subunit SA-1/2
MEPELRFSSPQPGLTQDTASPSRDRRKSGRATRRPELFSQTYSDANGTTAGGAKRKRTATGDENEDEVEDVSDSESEEVDEDDEPDEEELREKRRAARKASAKKTSSGTKSKPKTRGSRSAKKPKVTENGIRNQLPLRPAANGKKLAARPKKMRVRPSLAAGETGLYGMVRALPVMYLICLSSG